MFRIELTTFGGRRLVLRPAGGLDRFEVWREREDRCERLTTEMVWGTLGEVVAGLETAMDRLDDAA